LLSDPYNRFASPSWEHPLGTDIVGRDFLILTVAGAWEVLKVAAAASILTALVAIVVGISAGYKGGKLDVILMFIVNFLLTIPSFALIAILAGFLRFEESLYVAPIITLTAWPSLARAIRSQTLAIKESSFVEAARVLGVGTRHIIFSEILPHLTPYIAISIIFAFTGSIYALVGLYYLGFLPFTSINWGVMLNLGRGQMWNPAIAAKIYYVVPLIIIITLQLGAILLGRSIDKVFNPRLREE
jgi:peptide/nickel transport system permease protein